MMSGLHVSRSFEAWWSRASRINITDSLFAWNWVGMTNHIPGEAFCPLTGNPENTYGLANHIVNTLFIGHGDEKTNEMICNAGNRAKSSQESPAAIRQYDGAFWLSNSKWTNMSTVPCPSSSGEIKSLPYALVAGRQEDCNGKFPIQLYQSWPLGASPDIDAKSKWAWAMPVQQSTQNLGQFSGTSVCGRGPSGGVVDMTGTLDPIHPSDPVAYFAVDARGVQNPGELADYSVEQLQSMSYQVLPATQGSAVQSAAWSHQLMQNPDFAHTCGYCFYNDVGCPMDNTSWVFV
jgi:hypothetical protein